MLFNERLTLKRIAVAGADYEVALVVVDCTLEASRARGKRRWERGYRQALDAMDQGAHPDTQNGGRFVPSEFRRLVFPRPQASSVCLNVAMAMAWEFPNVTNFGSCAPGGGCRRASDHHDCWPAGGGEDPRR